MISRAFLVVLLVLGTVVVASAANQNRAEAIAGNTLTTITGRLGITYPADRPARYYLIDSLGPIELIPSPAGVGDLYRYEGVTIEVTGNLASQGNQRTLSVEKWAPLEARAAVGFPTVSGPQSTLLILVQFTDITGSHSVSYFQNLLTGASGSMNAYYVEVSYNMITVTGGPTSQWYTLPHASTYYNVDHWGDCSLSGDFDLLANDIVTLVDSTVNFAAYAHYMFVTADSYVWGCRVGGLHIWTNDGVYLENVAFVTENMGLDTFAHEFGHDITMPDLYDYSYTDPYHFIDGWDEMSVDNAQHYSSWSKIHQGWIPPSKIATFTGSTVTATIDRIEYSTSGYHVLKIKTSTMPTLFYFLVETRQKVGFDVNLPASAPDHGVLITKIDESKGSGQGIVRLVDANPSTQSSWDGDAVWQVGQTYTDASYGFSVSIQSWTGTGFVVTVNPPNGPPVVTGLSADKVSPQSVGSTVTFTATSSDPDGDTVLYRFYRLKSGGSWAIVRDWLSSNTYAWTASDVGDYQFAVWIRDGYHQGVNGGDDWSYWTVGGGKNQASGSTFTIQGVTTTTTVTTSTTTTNRAPSVTGFSADKSSPQSVGSTITFTTTASDPDGDTVLFRFYRLKSGGLWAIVRDWSSSNTYAWTASEAGDYQFAVWIRDGYHQGPSGGDDWSYWTVGGGKSQTSGSVFTIQ